MRDTFPFGGGLGLTIGESDSLDGRIWHGFEAPQSFFVVPNAPLPANLVSIQGESAAPGSTLADEVAFIGGVFPDGSLPLYTYYAWNNDQPATYTGGFTNTAKWGAPTASTTGGTVLYYFDPNSAWSPTEQQALTSGLALWSAVANISFAQTTTAAQAQITFTRGSDGQAATTPHETGAGGQTGGTLLLTLTGATVSIDTSVSGFGPLNGNFTTAGGYVIETVLHEEGHAIGLGHAGPYNVSVNDAVQQFGPFDSRLWSIMSYIAPNDTGAEYFNQYSVTGTNWGVGPDGSANEPTTWMPADILAVQALYGFPSSTPLSGGQIFGFNTNITGPIEPFFDSTKNPDPVVTLWDSGSGNTLDVSGFSQAAKVDLFAGAFSSVDGMINNIAIAFNTAIDSVVTGSGNDTITANNDGDTLTGSSGNDTLIGGTGSDTVVYSGNRANYAVSYNASTQTFTITDTRSGSPDGTDTVTGVENFRFADGTVSATSLIDQPPVLGGAGNTVGYTEQAAGVVVAAALSVGDPDSSTLAGATVAISGGLLSGDTLNFTNQNGIVGSYNASTGTLSLSGASSVANYQAALESVTFSSGSDNPTNFGADTTRTISWQTNDGFASSNSVSSTINITAVNDPPALSGAGNTVAFTEKGAAVLADASLVVGDVDSTTLSGATVVISSGYLSGDSLSFTSQSGITGSFNATTHTLSLSGTASVAAYQTALRSVGFSSSSNDPTNSGADTARTLTWQVDDGAPSNHASNTVTSTVHIDQPPVLGGAGNTVGYTEQAAGVVVAAALSVGDPDSSTLAGATVAISGGLLSGDTLNFTNQNGIVGSYNASTGTLSLSGASSVANYQAALESVTFSSGSDNPTNFGADTTRTISWQTNDGFASSNSVSSTINITAVNDPPALSGAGNTVAFTEKGAAVLADASLVVGDVDSTTLSGATVVISSGYLSGDSLSFTSQSGITGSFNATTHTLSLSGTASVAAYQTALRSVGFSSSSNDPTNSGADTARTLTWQVDDGAPSNHASNTVTSTVYIDQPPVLGGAGNTVGYTEQAAGVVVAAALSVGDPDSSTLAGATVAISGGLLSGDTLNFTNQNGIVGSYNASTGTLSLSGASSVANYQAALESVTFSSGSDNPTNFGADTTRTISWQTNDGFASSNSVSSTINITAVNDPPALSGAGNTVAFTEKGAAVLADASLVVGDVDSTTLSGATVVISSGYLSGDSLSFTSQSGITGSFNATTHTLSLSGTASVAAYQTALRSVGFSSSSNDPTNSGADTARTLTWQVDDGAPSNHASNTVTSTVAISHATGDFNGDGKSDIVWQNDDGTPAVWLMNGLSLIGGGPVVGNPGPAWHIVGAGDFNGDGKSDIAWQNNDGTPEVWLMNGLSLIGSGPVVGNPGPAWHIVGTGDFNGDGKSDIVWQNDDGTPAVWLMNGLSLIGGGPVVGNPGPAWHIVGTGDFNGDGKSDIVWQNDDGTPAVWLMNGLSLIGGGPVVGNPGPAWHIKGIGDFNGDGKSDIVWQNDDGTPAVWLMNGLSLIGGGPVVGNPGPAWHIKGIGDFNGDGKSDIVWQNDDGTPAVWLMNGLSLIGGGPIVSNPGPAWHIEGQGAVDSTQVHAAGASDAVALDLAGAPSAGTTSNDSAVAGLSSHGNDTLTAGGDTFVFALGDGLETITNFVPGNASNDVLVLNNCGVDSFSDLQSHMSQVGSDTVISFDAHDQITLHNVLMAQLNGGDFLFH